MFAADPDILRSIEDDAYEEIARSGAGKILVLEPTAYPVLRKRFKDKNVVYYLENLG